MPGGKAASRAAQEHQAYGVGLALQIGQMGIQGFKHFHIQAVELVRAVKGKYGQALVVVA